MSPRAKFLKQLKTFKILDKHQVMLDEMLDNQFYLAEAEVFRQGITLVYEHYLNTDAKK